MRFHSSFDVDEKEKEDEEEEEKEEEEEEEEEVIRGCCQNPFISESLA